MVFWVFKSEFSFWKLSPGLISLWVNTGAHSGMLQWLLYQTEKQKFSFTLTSPQVFPNSPTGNWYHRTASKARPAQWLNSKNRRGFLPFFFGSGVSVKSLSLFSSPWCSSGGKTPSWLNTVLLPSTMQRLPDVTFLGVLHVLISIRFGFWFWSELIVLWLLRWNWTY